ncbi:MAG: hypothetical protein AAFX06_29335 [Planctomycetota bacterium]
MNRFVLVATFAMASFAQLLPVAADVSVVSQRRIVQGDTFAIDGFFFEDGDAASDRIASSQPGLFDESIDVTADTGFAGNARAKAEQLSSISDPTTQGPELFISAEGSAESLVYIQGSADTRADSFFRVDFSLENAGEIAFEDVALSVSSGVNQGSASEARVILRVIDRDSGTRVYNKVVRLDDQGTAQTFADRFIVDLDAGRYRLILRAIAEDQTNGIEELVADARASFFVEAEVTEH